MAWIQAGTTFVGPEFHHQQVVVEFSFRQNIMGIALIMAFPACFAVNILRCNQPRRKCPFARSETDCQLQRRQRQNLDRFLRRNINRPGLIRSNRLILSPISSNRAVGILMKVYPATSTRQRSPAAESVTPSAFVGNRQHDNKCDTSPPQISPASRARRFRLLYPGRAYVSGCATAGSCSASTTSQP